MSSTTGIQNLLVNVVRPVYTYDSTTSLYSVKLDMSNINTFYGVSANVLWAQVGDSANNVYVGKEAGNDPTVTVKACRNVTAIGYGAGSNISNVSNSTYLGYYAGAGAATANDVIAIGTNANGNGVSNIYIGDGTGVSGAASNNILIGHGIDLSGVSYAMRVGAVGKTTIAADLSQAWVGVGGVTSRSATQTTLDVSGSAYVSGNVGINILPGTRTLDVNGNFRASSGGGILQFNDSLLDVSNGAVRVSDAAGSVDISQGLVAAAGFLSTSSVLPNMAANFTVDVGVLKKGVVLVSAQDTANTTTHYASTMAYCSDPTNGTYVTAMTSNVQSGEVTVSFPAGTPYVRISNANTIRSVAWSITYFPLP